MIRLARRCGFAHRLLAVVLVCSGSAAPAQNVRLQNGNFSITYTDVALAGGPRRPAVERTYNSQTVYRGVFGAGWSSEPETSLRAMPDGSVLVLEHGGGRENRFVAHTTRPLDVRAMVARLVGAATRAGVLAASDAILYRKRLVEDTEYRSDEWAKFLAAGLVSAPAVAAGTVFRSTTLGEQALVKTPGGYRRIDARGDRFEFDRSGRLMEIHEATGGSLRFERDAQGRVATIVESNGRSTRLHYDARGRVERIDAPDAREVRYRYNDRDELVWSEDIDGHRYSFFYDPAGRHNLVEVAYEDGTTLAITYLTGAQGNRVGSVREADGSFASYVYEDDAATGRRSVTERATRAGNAATTVTRREYVRLADGTEWLREERVSVDGTLLRRVLYHARCGRPEEMEDGTHKVVVRYGESCEVLQVDRSGN